MSDEKAPEGSLGRASALMASGSIVSRALGVVRNGMLVACIGEVGAASDAFQTANTLPNLIFALLSGGILTALLIPQITKSMQREEGSQDAINALLTAAFGLVAAVTLIATVAAAPLIAFFRLSGDALELGVAFAFICLPQIFFYGAYAILSQVLNVRGRFGVTMWTPALANVVQIVGMVFFLSRFAHGVKADRWTPEMIWLLAGTSTLGIVIQAIGLLPALWRTGFRWRPNFTLRGHGFSAAGRVAAWMILAVGVSQVGAIVTRQAINDVSGRAQAAGHAVAGLMIYQLAFTIFMVPHGIVTTSILTALFPRMARSAQRHDNAALRADTARGLTMPAVGMVPLSFAAVALAVPGVSVLNPSMGAEGVRTTSLVFSLMAIGLVPFGIAALQQRFSMAREDGRTNLSFQIIVTAMQVAVAGLILFLPDEWGVAVTALGQTVGNTIAACAFLWMAQRQLGGLPLRELARLYGRLGAACIAPAIFAWITCDFLGRTLRHGWLTSLGTLTAGGVVFVVLFLVMARLMRIEELQELASRVTGRFLRR